MSANNDSNPPDSGPAASRPASNNVSSPATITDGRATLTPARDAGDAAMCAVLPENWWAVALPPIIFPGRPEGWWSDEALKAEPDTPQATLEQRHQAAGDVLALHRHGFFSAGVLFSMASHSPVETAQ